MVYGNCILVYTNSDGEIFTETGLSEPEALENVIERKPADWIIVEAKPAGNQRDQFYKAEVIRRKKKEKTNG
jgi:hypothetical protein